jgi:hypothetical protein
MGTRIAGVLAGLWAVCMMGGCMAEVGSEADLDGELGYAEAELVTSSTTSGTLTGAASSAPVPCLAGRVYFAGGCRPASWFASTFATSALISVHGFQSSTMVVDGVTYAATYAVLVERLAGGGFVQTLVSTAGLPTGWPRRNGYHVIAEVSEAWGPDEEVGGFGRHREGWTVQSVLRLVYDPALRRNRWVRRLEWVQTHDERKIWRADGSLWLCDFDACSELMEGTNDDIPSRQDMCDISAELREDQALEQCGLVAGAGLAYLAVASTAACLAAAAGGATLPVCVLGTGLGALATVVSAGTYACQQWAESEAAASRHACYEDLRSRTEDVEAPAGAGSLPSELPTGSPTDSPACPEGFEYRPELIATSGRTRTEVNPENGELIVIYETGSRTVWGCFPVEG